MLFALWIVAMMLAAQGMTAATDPFTEASRQIDTGRTFDKQGDFESALATYRRASEALRDDQPIGGTLRAPHKLFGLRPEATRPTCPEPATIPPDLLSPGVLNSHSSRRLPSPVTSWPHITAWGRVELLQDRLALARVSRNNVYRDEDLCT